MNLIDTHCHIDFPVFETDRERILNKCQSLGFTKLIVPGVCENQWSNLLQITDRYSLLSPAVGLHPCYLPKSTSKSIETLASLLKQKDQVIAVGEIGLDFFIKNHDVKTQVECFQKQLDLAKTNHLPVILHVRKAHDQIAKIIKQKNFSFGGIVHCYSGSLQQAQKYLKFGFKLGVGGVVTYERSLRLRKIIRELPLSSFVIETDAPDIPPLGKEKKRNSPEYLPQIFESFARLRHENKAEIEKQLYKNTVEIFPKLRN